MSRAVAKALVKVGMNFICNGEVLLGEGYLLFVPGELAEGAVRNLIRSAVVSVSDIGNGNGF